MEEQEKYEIQQKDRHNEIDKVEGLLKDARLWQISQTLKSYIAAV